MINTLCIAVENSLAFNGASPSPAVFKRLLIATI